MFITIPVSHSCGIWFLSIILLNSSSKCIFFCIFENTSVLVISWFQPKHKSHKMFDTIVSAIFFKFHFVSGAAIWQPPLVARLWGNVYCLSMVCVMDTGWECILYNNIIRLRDLVWKCWIPGWYPNNWYVIEATSIRNSCRREITSQRVWYHHCINLKTAITST